MLCMQILFLKSNTVALTFLMAYCWLTHTPVTSSSISENSRLEGGEALKMKWNVLVIRALFGYIQILLAYGKTTTYIRNKTCTYTIKKIVFLHQCK